jgi:hypothetical protein
MVHEQKAKEQSGAPQVFGKIVFYISRRGFYGDASGKRVYADNKHEPN